MATSDYTIADQTGASFLTDINGQLDAIKSTNSDTETSGNPTNIASAVYEVDGFMWFDTTNDIIKVRSSSAWVKVLSGTVATTELANIAEDTVLGRTDSGAGAVSALSVSDMQSMLSIASYTLSGTTLTITT